MTDDAIVQPPYGNSLINLIPPLGELAELKVHANSLASLQISERAVCDLELLATGAFSPLDRFMGQADYQRVLAEMRLGNDYLFPIPITSGLSAEQQFQQGKDIVLRNRKNEMLAIMTVAEVMSGRTLRQRKRFLELKIYGTRSSRKCMTGEDSTSQAGCKCCSCPATMTFQIFG